MAQKKFKVAQKSNQKENKIVSQHITEQKSYNSNNDANIRVSNNLLYIIIIIGICLLLYGRAVFFGYTYADDDWLIIDNLAFNKDLANIIKSFTHILGTTYYRPLLNISFIIDAQISETNILMYHVTNLIYHICGSLLVYFTLKKLNLSLVFSLILAIFFAVHPILTPAVCWISGRNDSLLTIFILLSFINIINYQNTLNKNNTKYLILTSLFYVFALFTKEVAIVLPFIVLLYIFINHKKNIYNNKNKILYSVCIVLTILWFILRTTVISKMSSPDMLGLEAFIKNIPTFFAIIGKIFVPYKMNALSVFDDIAIYIGIVFSVLLFVLPLIIKSINKSNYYFGMLWFILFLMPSLFVRILYVDDFFDYAEHRAYLPMLGILIMIYETLKAWRIDFSTTFQKAFGIAIILLFVVRTFVYSGVFDDRFKFWTYFVDMYPQKSRGYYYLAKCYISKDDLQSAEKYFAQGVKNNPKSDKLYTDFATLYAKREDFIKAGYYASKALAIDSNNSTCNFYYGKYLNLQKQYNQAILHLKKATRNNPSSPYHWWIELGISYYELHQTQLAIEAYQVALAQNTEDSDLYANLGAAYFDLGKFQEAETLLLKSISKAKKIDQFINLIFFYMNTRNFEKAKYYSLEFQSKGGVIPPDIKKVLNIN